MALALLRRLPPKEACHMTAGSRFFAFASPCWKSATAELTASERVISFHRCNVSGCGIELSDS